VPSKIIASVFCQVDHRQIIFQFLDTSSWHLKVRNYCVYQRIRLNIGRRRNMIIFRTLLTIFKVSRIFKIAWAGGKN